MTSVSHSGYGVPIEAHFQPVLFDPGNPTKKNDDALSYRGLEKRLGMLRKVKLELEESNIRKEEKIEHLTKRLETVNTAMHSKGEVYKELYKSEEKLNRARLRMKELTARINEVVADNDRMQNTVDKFRDEYKCAGPCGMVRSYKAFARDPRSITGREKRCNRCQAQKTASWRAAKKLLAQ